MQPELGETMYPFGARETQDGHESFHRQGSQPRAGASCPVDSAQKWLKMCQQDQVDEQQAKGEHFSQGLVRSLWVAMLSASSKLRMDFVAFSFLRGPKRPRKETDAWDLRHTKRSQLHHLGKDSLLVVSRLQCQSFWVSRGWTDDASQACEAHNLLERAGGLGCAAVAFITQHAPKKLFEPTRLVVK